MAVLILSSKVDKLEENVYDESFVVDTDRYNVFFTVSREDITLSCGFNKYEAEYLRDFLTTFLKEKQNI